MKHLFRKIGYGLTAGWLGLFYATSAQAELTVIYDSGDTQSMAPFFVPLQPDKPEPVLHSKKHGELSPRQYLGPADIRNLLPIQSPGISAGILPKAVRANHQQTRLAKANPRPFFLVGSDTFSYKWLVARRVELIQMGAVGMVVLAETEEDVRRIADVARGISVTLGSASDIAEALGIQHYPVLITAKGIEQ